MSNQSFNSSDLILRLAGGPRDGQIVTVQTPKCFLGVSAREGSSRPHCAIFRGSKGTTVRSYSGEVLVNGHPSTVHWLNEGDQIELPNSVSVHVEQLGRYELPEHETSNANFELPESGVENLMVSELRNGQTQSQAELSPNQPTQPGEFQSNSEMNEIWAEHSERIDGIEQQIQEIQTQNEMTHSRFDRLDTRLDSLGDQMDHLVTLATDGFANQASQSETEDLESVAEPTNPGEGQGTEPNWQAPVEMENTDSTVDSPLRTGQPTQVLDANSALLANQFIESVVEEDAANEAVASQEVSFQESFGAMPQLRTGDVTQILPTDNEPESVEPESVEPESVEPESVEPELVEPALPTYVPSQEQFVPEVSQFESTPELPTSDYVDSTPAAEPTWSEPQAYPTGMETGTSFESGEEKIVGFDANYHSETSPASSLDGNGAMDSIGTAESQTPSMEQAPHFPAGLGEGEEETFVGFDPNNIVVEEPAYAPELEQESSAETATGTVEVEEADESAATEDNTESQAITEEEIAARLADLERVFGGTLDFGDGEESPSEPAGVESQPEQEFEAPVESVAIPEVSEAHSVTPELPTADEVPVVEEVVEASVPESCEPAEEVAAGVADMESRLDMFLSQVKREIEEVDAPLEEPIQTANDQSAESFESQTHGQDVAADSFAGNTILTEDLPNLSGLEGLQSGSLASELLADHGEAAAADSTGFDHPHGLESELPVESAMPAEGSLASQLLQEVQEESLHQSIEEETVSVDEANSDQESSDSSEGGSLQDVLSRMQESGQWNGLPDDDQEVAPVEPVSVAPPVEPTPEPVADDGEEGDVEDYMSQLLSRMRGGEPAQPKAAAPTVQAKPEPAMSAEPVEARPEPQELLTPEEFKPKAKAVKPKSFEAMRELANSSARTAVQKSDRARKKTLSYVQAGIAVGSFVLSAYYLVVASTQVFDVPFLLGLLCVATSLAFCYRLYRTMQTRERAAAAKAAKAAKNNGPQVSVTKRQPEKPQTYDDGLGDVIE